MVSPSRSNLDMQMGWSFWGPPKMFFLWVPRKTDQNGGPSKKGTSKAWLPAASVVIQVQKPGPCANSPRISLGWVRQAESALLECHHGPNPKSIKSNSGSEVRQEPTKLGCPQCQQVLLSEWPRTGGRGPQVRGGDWMDCISGISAPWNSPSHLKRGYPPKKETPDM